MSEKLAIHGGTPVFQGEELKTLAPKWPVSHPETEAKLLELYRGNRWSVCAEYEQQLMRDFAAFQGTEYSVWMCNGTTTLECALLALGIGHGDEVIVPGVSWLATAQAPMYAGARTVLVDIDPETLCIDPEKIEEAITPRTRAIIPVHVFSAIADMDRICAIARKHGLHVLEDCAHAHGSRQHGKGVGSFGEFGSFSFQQSKLMTAGEGGCLITGDRRLADLAFRASHIGSSCILPDEPLKPGLMCHQYRFTEFQAVILCDQLRHLPEQQKKRIENMALAAEIFKDDPGMKLQKSSYDDDVRGYYFPTLLLQTQNLRPEVTRKDIFDAARAEGVLPAFLNEGWGEPMYRMPQWNMLPDRYVKHDTPVCEEVMEQRFMCSVHRLLLADASTVERWAMAVKKVVDFFLAV